MKKKLLALTLSAALFASVAHQSQAQSAPSAASASMMTRAQVKMDRDEFIKSHRWDSESETWVLKRGVEPPAPMKGRAEVLKERDDFLKKNSWDASTGTWIPLKEPRAISLMTRKQVRDETRNFVRTHEWDEATEAWTPKPKPRK